ncbi:MAG: hypothetical protein ACYS1A_17890 [Planctomycetota bacterium]|jgi:hypothetical protein
MGINIDTMDFFYESLKIAGIAKLKDLWLLELGNQCIRSEVKKKYGCRSGKSKVYFLDLRCHHHAIDRNGEDGAIPLDLCEPIPIPRFINAFEIVTDFGCLEHVRGGAITTVRDHWKPGEGQWQAWKNIHDMGKMECVYLHTVPRLGSFRNHGSYHYTFQFFKDLCKSNEYEILDLKSNQNDPRFNTREYIFCTYRKKQNNQFAPEWDVFKEWLHR